MGLKLTAHIEAPSDVPTERERLLSEIASSSLALETKEHVKALVTSALNAIAIQLSVPDRSIHAKRSINGPGYEITILLGPKREGIVASIRRRLGL